jgi:hypothetical protein
VHLQDDVLLQSVHHLHRLSRRQRYHVSHCARCQQQRKALLQLLGTDPPLPSTTPPWPRVAPVATTSQRHPGRTVWVTAVGLVAVLTLMWPKLLWPNAPLAPTVLKTLLTVKPVRLKPVSLVVHGNITVIANRGTGWLLLQYRHVSPLRHGLVYEVWWIQDGHHIRAGVFRVVRGSETLWLHTSTGVADATAVGITIEPAPGVAHPTGPRTFFGTF